MGRDGVLDHVQNGDGLEGGLFRGNVHKAALELTQQGSFLGRGAAKQHSGVGLRKGLTRRVHRNGDAHGVGEVRGDEGGCEGDRFFSPALRVRAQNDNREAVGHGLPCRNGHGTGTLD